LPSFGSAPEAPSKPNTAPSAGRFDPDFPTFAAPPAILPIVPTAATPGAGGGGGGRGKKDGRGSKRPMNGEPVLVNPYQSPYPGVFVPGNSAYEPDQGGTASGFPVNITVNTVSADANLPTLIVGALQQYNLVNGPIDVTIAA
jgi:hypothetical protein